MSVECLENRVMLAATSFNYGSLTGYTDLGTSLTYNTNYTLTTNMTNPSSGSGTETVYVSKDSNHSKEIDVQSISDSGSTSDMVLEYTSKGLVLVGIDSSPGGSPLQLSFTGTALGPKELVEGTKYTDGGSFSLSGKITAKGSTTTLSATGNASTSSQLFGRQTIDILSESYSTVKGVYAVTASGSLQAKIDGKEYHGKFEVTFKTTFWAIPGGGLAEFQAATDETVTVSGQGTVTRPIACLRSMIPRS